METGGHITGKVIAVLMGFGRHIVYILDCGIVVMSLEDRKYWAGRRGGKNYAITFLGESDDEDDSLPHARSDDVPNRSKFVQQDHLGYAEWFTTVDSKY